MSDVKRYYLTRNRDHERVLSEITPETHRFLRIKEDEYVRAADYEELDHFVTRSNNAMRAALGDELWSMGHPAFVVVHLRDELAKVTRLWKEASVQADLTWVIEGAWSPTSAPDYWGGSSHWSPAPYRALRFATEASAVQAADMMLSGINYRICCHSFAQTAALAGQGAGKGE
jgi:acetoin utilization deacetylase AcuC-like enzyme